MGTTVERLQALNMIERKEPSLVKFAEGERIVGVLLRIERIEVDKKPVTRYIVENLDGGELVQFLGTYQINAKLRTNDVGHVIDVRYEGEDLNVVRNGNSMRRFKVLVSDTRLGDEAPAVAGVDGTLITDDDIRF
jgi:hypothetical protein